MVSIWRAQGDTGVVSVQLPASLAAAAPLTIDRPTFETVAAELLTRAIEPVTKVHRYTHQPWAARFLSPALGSTLRHQPWAARFVTSPGHAPSQSTSPHTPLSPATGPPHQPLGHTSLLV